MTGYMSIMEAAQTVVSACKKNGVTASGALTIVFTADDDVQRSVGVLKSGKLLGVEAILRLQTRKLETCMEFWCQLFDRKRHFAFSLSHRQSDCQIAPTTP